MQADCCVQSLCLEELRSGSVDPGVQMRQHLATELAKIKEILDTRLGALEESVAIMSEGMKPFDTLARSAPKEA